VLSGYEDGLDEDDEEGSRAIPSRTTFGCESAFIKEFPCYGGSRRYFFGLVTVRNWAYRCELTLPQIELMMSDLPHTLYRRHQNETNNPKGLKKSEYDEAVRRNMESIRKSRERRKKERAEQAPTIEELFNGVADEE